MPDLLALTEDSYAGGYLVGAARRAQDRPAPHSGPCISIVVPTHRPPLGYLARAVRSVCRQSYGNWQLVLADDASPGPETRAYLQTLAAQDPRITLVASAVHGHISRTSNLALAEARGAYVTFLDQDDELAPYALAEVVAALERRPNARLIYSDEDHVDAFGTRFQPYFKPDWSPDLLLSQNYVCHLAVYPRDFVAQLGGFRAGYEGSQDHDLVLRASRQLRADEVVHVPEVLYHWRTLANSTAAYGAAAKPYALEAGRRALVDHVARATPQAEVRATRGFYEVRWPAPQGPVRVAVVLHGGNDATCAQATHGWRQRTPSDVGGAAVQFHVAVQADANEADATQAINEAVRRLDDDPPDVLILAHAELRPRDEHWLDETLRQVTREQIGCVGGKVLDTNGAIAELGLLIDPVLGPCPAHAGSPADGFGYFGRTSIVHNVSAVGRAFLAVRFTAWHKQDGLPCLSRAVLEDTLFAARVAACGHRHVVLPQLLLQNARPAPSSAVTDDAAATKAASFAEITAEVGPDVCHSPHLTTCPVSHNYRVFGPRGKPTA